jgi:hypothetical protein
MTKNVLGQAVRAALNPKILTGAALWCAINPASAAIISGGSFDFRFCTILQHQLS